MNDLKDLLWSDTTSSAPPPSNSVNQNSSSTRRNNPFAATSPSKTSTTDAFAGLVESRKTKQLTLAEQTGMFIIYQTNRSAERTAACKIAGVRSGFLRFSTI